MVKAPLVIPRTYISQASIIDPTKVLKYVRKSSKISKKVDNAICPKKYQPCLLRLGLIQRRSMIEYS